MAARSNMKMRLQVDSRCMSTVVRGLSKPMSARAGGLTEEAPSCWGRASLTSDIDFFGSGSCIAKRINNYVQHQHRAPRTRSNPSTPRLSLSTYLNHTLGTMNSLGSGLSAFPNDPKVQIMQQIQQEAAMQNARMLVEVRDALTSFPSCAKSYQDHVRIKVVKLYTYGSAIAFPKFTTCASVSTFTLSLLSKSPRTNTIK